MPQADSCSSLKVMRVKEYGWFASEKYSAVRRPSILQHNPRGDFLFADWTGSVTLKP
jgi:hypothetical protein